MMKKVKMFFGSLFLSMAMVLSVGMVSRAAEDTEMVDVTIPSELNIVFEENGTEGIGSFYVRNQSPVPITLKSVRVTEKNGWKLVSEKSEIRVDTKEIAFQLDGCNLLAGENEIAVSVMENAEKTLNVAVKRGAWTNAREVQSAFHMEFFYTVGKAPFQLTFHSDGGSSVSSVQACNGDRVTLPTSEKGGYDFLGWIDDKGTVHNGTFVMPIGNTTLKAKWGKKVAYAVYSADDKSLTFYNTSNQIVVGGVYNGKKVTAVYTDFLDKSYAYNNLAPWTEDYETEIKRIVVHDKISPTSTCAWFLYLVNCEYVDVTNMDMSKVTTMKQMFSLTGNTTSTFKLIGMKDWDVSQVTDISSMFNGTGRDAATFYMDDIGNWNVSNVTKMQTVFIWTGRDSRGWKLDLSRWDVKKVTNHNRFVDEVGGTIIQPKWVN